MTTHDTLLIFRIDRVACAVAAESVQSIVMPPSHLTQPPGSDKARPGIFRHGEHVFSVIDLHQRFGIETPRKGVGRLLLYEKGIRRYALWVDEVVGLARHEEGEWAPLPPYLPKTLFQNGFLYQKEIVLCSTLDALLQMQDVEAIRLHLQSLQPTEPETPSVEKTDSNKSEAQTAEKREYKPELKHHQTPVEKKAPIGTQRPTTPPRVRPPIARPVKPKAVVTTPKKHLPERKVVPERRPSEPKIYSKPKSIQTASTPPTVSTAPTHVINTPSSGSRVVWLLLLVLVLGGGGIGAYQWWVEKADIKVVTKAPVPPPASAPVQVPAISRQTPAALLVDAETPHTDVAPELLDKSKVIVKPEPEQVPESALETTPEPVIPKEAAIQIETDSEGTISLIIERELLRPSSTPQAEPAPSPEDKEPLAKIKESPLSSEESPSPTTVEVEEEEAPLVPDSDWPQPASLPEPCDCTHIVVKGDTLWDIAAKYTNNAFNYPELARQSGIRNPHRIYPGNKVRIIVR